MPDTARPDALLQAVREHATALPASVEDATDSELAVLDDVIRDARVIALGEATHFVAEFGAAQQRLIRYLVERHGVTVLAHEFGFAEGATLNRWLHGHGADDQLDLHQGPHARSDATRDRWRWLREYNSVTAHPVRFVGLDTPGAGGTVRPVLEPLQAFLQRADPDAVGLAGIVQDIAGRFESLSQAGSAPLWAQLPNADRDALTATLSRLSLRMNALRPHYLARTGPAEVDRARRHLDIAIATEYMVRAIHDLLFSTAALPYDTSIRDRLMADSLFWHLERVGPGDRVVLLAHNLHIQKTTTTDDADPVLSMGRYLADALGDSYRAIALAHTARLAPAITMSTDDPHGFVVAQGPVADPPPDGLEGALIAAGLDSASSFLPLHPLRGNDRTAPKSLGTQGAHVPTDVPAAFDAVVTVPTATLTEHRSLY